MIHNVKDMQLHYSINSVHRTHCLTLLVQAYLDPVEEILSQPDVPVVAELDFTGTGNNTGGEVDIPEQQVVEVVEVEDGKRISTGR